MLRIDTATKSVDKFGSGKHGFADGNPTLGTPATDLEATWFDMVQEAIVRTIEAAGLTPDDGDYDQFVTALNALYATLDSPALTDSPTAPTQSQFDAGTMLATTEFVRVAGAHASQVDILTTSTSLSAAHGGRSIISNSASGLTHTMPAAVDVRAGSKIEWMNIGTASCTVQRAGSDSFTVSNSTVTSIVIQSGGTLTLESDGSGNWYAVAGTAQLAYSGAFAASLASSGYQKMPSGLIFQWKTVAMAGTTQAFTWPIAFPTANFSACANDSGTVQTAIGIDLGTSGGTLYAAVAPGGVYVFGVGY